jgi:hypothetical protein
MRAPTRNLQAAGADGAEVADRLLDGLAGGMVLLHRKVKAGTGIEARRLAQNWVAMRPVIIDGLVVELIEDEATDEVNKVGRLRYGLRPSDVDKRLLRAICPDVFWLGPRGAQKVIETGRVRPVDMWSQLRPSAVNHVPAHDGRPATVLGVGSDATCALGKLSRGDGQAIAALLEGLHLVDVADVVTAASGRSERRTWRPMRPAMGEGGVPVGYQKDARVARHTVNAGRTGFSGATYAAISPLLVETGYDPRDGEMGHAYRLADEHVDAARNAIGWVAEVDRETAGTRDGRGVTRAPVTPPTERQSAIMSMLEGRDYVPTGEAPTHEEVAEAIAMHGGTTERMAKLITEAMTRAAATGKATAGQAREPRRWWRL